MAAMVAAAALADEPVAELGLELSGDSTLTWGVDLDEGDTGFKNEANAKAVVTFVKEGTKSTEGDGVWAEVGVKFDGDLKYKLEGDGSDAFVKDGGKIALDVAKLHIGDLYIGLKSGDIQVGEFKLQNAVVSSSDETKMANVGSDAETQGLVAGYGTDDFGIAVDFRSVKAGAGTGAGDPIKVYLVTDGTAGTAAVWEVADADGTSTHVTEGEANTGWTILDTKEIPGDAGSANDDYYTNHYGIAAEVELKDSNAFVPGLFAKAGVSYGFDEKLLGLSASAGYKLAVGDTFYLKPAVGFTGTKADGTDFDASLGASVLFGWGDEADANAGVYYLDNDETKKVTPGVGVAFGMPLTEEHPSFTIIPSFYSGDIVEGLKAAAIGEFLISTVDGADPVYGFIAGVSYELPVGDSIKVTPKAGFRFANTNAGAGLLKIFGKENTDNGGYGDVADADGTDAGLLNVKAGLDVSGIIENTTFGAYYQSRNLRAVKDDGKAGTFNVFVKVSL